jgi:hypothetical protein
MAVIFVSRDDVYAASIRQKLIDSYTADSERENKKRETERLIHVSDTIFPRKTYYQVVQGRKITDTAIGFWFTGKAYHAELQRVLGAQYAEVAAQMDDFVAHMDYYDGLLIGEIKTSRKWTVPLHAPGHYIRQTGYYCAMSNKLNAKIIVIYPTSGRTWRGEKSSTVEIGAWDLTLTPDLLPIIQQDMRTVKSKIIEALDAQNPQLLPPVPPWILSEFENADPGEYSEKEENRFPFYYSDIEVQAT